MPPSFIKSCLVRLAFLPLLACLLSNLPAPAAASVVLTGTRVIYPAALSSKTLQLSNDDAHPWLVQMWLDAGNEDSTPETDDSAVPFVLNPPIFRMEPGSGQAVRLLFTGTPALPKDRESVFYLNFTQIPALAAADMEANQLVLLVRNRVKVLYRPHRLSRPDTHKMACALRFVIADGQVQVDNPSAFHATIQHAELRAEDGPGVTLLSGQMLAPFSQQQWPLDAPFTVPVHAQVRVTLVNDYGASEAYTCPWR